MTADEPLAGGKGPPLIVGRLLVATPMLLDPNFYRTVVYMAEHSSEGAVGIVLNRPSAEVVRDHLPQWHGLMSEPRVVFVGGPVANEIAIGLARDPIAIPEEWDPAASGIGLLDLAGGPEAVVGVGDARAYSGYAGWIRSQLEAELRTGSWVLVDAFDDDVFTDEPDALWRKVLQRQEGAARLYASFPDDLGSN